MNAISPIEGGGLAAVAAPLSPERAGRSASEFGAMLSNGVDRLNQNIGTAEQALNAFALGESVSTHELMLAMEKARWSLQVAVEVRNRLIEAYGELTRMQV